MRSGPAGDHRTPPERLEPRNKMAVVARKSVLAAGAYPEAVEEEPALEFGPAQATAPRKREIKWVYLTPLVFLFLPLINYGARA